MSGLALRFACVIARAKISSIFVFHKVLNSEALKVEPMTLDDILDCLKDGKWHSTRELMVCVSVPKLEKILEFMAHFQMVEWNRQSGYVRLDYFTIVFLKTLFEDKAMRWQRKSRGTV